MPCKGAVRLITPPPNLTGDLHVGNALNLVCSDIYLRHAELSNREVYARFCSDHAGQGLERIVNRGVGVDKPPGQRLRCALRHCKTVSDDHMDTLSSLGVDWLYGGWTLGRRSKEVTRHAFVSLYRGGHLAEKLYPTFAKVTDEVVTFLDSADVDLVRQPKKLYAVDLKLVDDGGSQPAAASSDAGSPDGHPSRHSDSEDYITVHTTKPALLHASAAVAVSDSTSGRLKGKAAVLPGSHRRIPLIASGGVDDDRATLVMPGYLFEDYQLALKHGLDVIDITDERGRLKNVVPELENLTIAEAERKIIDGFAEVATVEEPSPTLLGDPSCDVYTLPAPHWLLDVSAISGPALDAMAGLEVDPPSRSSMLRQRVASTQPWCISRYGWWGLRVPVWYLRKDGVSIPFPAQSQSEAEQMVAQYLQCSISDALSRGYAIEQDTRTLDTWFTSALWPITTTPDTYSPPLAPESFDSITLSDGIPLEGVVVNREAGGEVDEGSTLEEDAMASMEANQKDGVDRGGASNYDFVDQKGASNCDFVDQGGASNCDFVDQKGASNCDFVDQGGTPKRDLALSHAATLCDANATRVLYTCYDILHSWVARMLLLCTWFSKGKLPFDKLVLHGLVNDSSGRKMSKSEGNTVTAKEFVEGFGQLPGFPDLSKPSEIDILIAKAVGKSVKHTSPLAMAQARLVLATAASKANVCHDLGGYADRVKSLLKKVANITKYVSNASKQHGLDHMWDVSPDEVGKTFVERLVAAGLSRAGRAVGDCIETFSFRRAFENLEQYVSVFSEYAIPSHRHGDMGIGALATGYRDLLRLLMPFTPQLVTAMPIPIGMKDTGELFEWPTFGAPVAEDERAFDVLESVIRQLRRHALEGSENAKVEAPEDLRGAVEAHRPLLTYLLKLTYNTVIHFNVQS
ncbi:tRNA synthetases class I (I, L, M and V) family protein, putative [Babesia bigemina]|uniref:valine--tRNA ligase n=1 Tax=Babesia bigemina TaxID=5866 RepID=A0A061DCR6_BABBI|nr:tRNA synthetases class I (I, L, M and V) family protein, putative [Babesia bigemina]CDR96839.1 tRNA synthetases class I (I, L, M and V) family protein, putative [Babesia bigemina]|eukprot:XP_012769025.1 tRNA synthetases class I (I, L, M and V) family protein, putative [Babesia bigemina]